MTEAPTDDPVDEPATTDVTEVHDRRRAWRIQRGEQHALDVPVTTVRTIAAGSAHARSALARALGPRTIAAVMGEPDATSARRGTTPAQDEPGAA